jgi:hypothetical protein
MKRLQQRRLRNSMATRFKAGEFVSARQRSHRTAHTDLVTPGHPTCIEVHGDPNQRVAGATYAPGSVDSNIVSVQPSAFCISPVSICA